MSNRVMNCPHCGRILPEEFWHEKSQVDKPVVKCPLCGSTKNWKDAKRHAVSATFQRYYCRDCGHRFSMKQPIS